MRSRIIEPYPKRWQQRGWLAAIAGLHVLAFLCWQPPQRLQTTSTVPHAVMTYILPPSPSRSPSVIQPQPQPQARPRPAPVARPTANTASAPPSQVQPQPITTLPPDQQAEPQPQAMPQAALPPDPFAPPAKPELDLKQRAIAAAAAADKAALKESFTQRDRKLVNDESALAVAIGKAYRGGGRRMVEIVGADGSRITKFILPGGTEVCYKAAPNTFAGGRDPFRDSGRVVVSNCP